MITKKETNKQKTERNNLQIKKLLISGFYKRNK